MSTHPFIAFIILILTLIPAAGQERLVILHTNDTHSQIEPDSKGLGGIARRKVLIDSIRTAEPATILIDAGDAVQGTLYFSLFRGQVEDSLMNLLGYDIQILGNHEFDNGTDELARRWSRLKADRLSTNYDLTELPALDSIFDPYTIRTVGDKRIGFMAINLDPKGMIADANATGVKYLEPIQAANATAWWLRNILHCDYVVAVTHIGYSLNDLPDDLDIARQTRGINMVIGGHSHTAIDPADPKVPLHRVTNLDGDTVVIAQNGKAGRTLGQIDLDLTSGHITQRLIPVDARLDNRLDPAIDEYLRPFRASIDSLVSIKLAKATADFPQGSPEEVNMAADFVASEGARISGRKVDMAIMNRGGLRRDIPRGTITRGEVMELMPFDNRIVVMEISGADLAEAFEVMARQGGNGISGEARATFHPESRTVTDVTIGGEPIDPARIYTLSTIDYLANGGDYMTPLTRGRVIATDPRIAYDAMADYLSRIKRISPDKTVRMAPSR